MMMRMMAKHCEGLNRRQDDCLLTTGKGILIVDGIQYGGRMLNIKTSQVIDILMEYTTEEQEVSKSAIKRGVIGGLAFGPAGLVLGGLSGVGSKKKMVNQEYLTIRYSLNGGDDGRFCMFFIKQQDIGKAQKFIKKVQEQMQ